MKNSISILPSEVVIDSFTLPVTDLPYPAITICKKRGLYDPGEYLRAVFNQFKYAYRKDDKGSCNETDLLRRHYKNFISQCDQKPRDITDYVENEFAKFGVSTGLMIFSHVVLCMMSIFAANTRGYRICKVAPQNKSRGV